MFLRESEQRALQRWSKLAIQLNGAFDPEYPEVHVGPRQEISEEGERISQWELKLNDFAAFVKRRRK